MDGAVSMGGAVSMDGAISTYNGVACYPLVTYAGHADHHCMAVQLLAAICEAAHLHRYNVWLTQTPADYGTCRLCARPCRHHTHTACNNQISLQRKLYIMRKDALLQSRLCVADSEYHALGRSWDGFHNR